MLRNLKIISYFAIILFCFCGCGEEKKEAPTSVSDNEQSDTSHDSSNTLVVGTSADFPPFEFMKNSEIIGFDIDLIKAIAEKLNMKVEIKDMQFYALIPSLENGDINVAIAGMAETEERARKIDFSKPYYFNKFALLVKGEYDSNNPIKSGMKIGVQAGTVMHQWIKNYSVDVNVMTMDRNLELVENLKNQRIDGILLDEISAKDIMQNNPTEGLSIVSLNSVHDDGISIGVKNNSPLLDGINKALTELEENGKLDELKKKWGL